MAVELVADDPADFPGMDHPPQLGITDPLHAVRFAGQQLDFLQRYRPLQAVVVKEHIALFVRIQQLKFLRIGTDARFLEKLPGNGLPAGLPCLGRAAGVLPGAGKTFFLGTAGQQKSAVSVMHPHADNQTVFAVFPWCPPFVDTPCKSAVFVINIVPSNNLFHPETSQNQQEVFRHT